MNTFGLTTIFALLAAANAGFLAPNTLIAGPSSRTTVFGSDGSLIDSINPGSRIIEQGDLGLIGRAAPFIGAAPALAYSAPTFVRSAPLAYSAPLVAAPLTTGWAERTIADNVIAGPSGSIVTGKTIAEPWVASAPLISRGLYL